MGELSFNQKAAHFSTLEHIREVQKLMYHFQCALGERALDHDRSKIEHPVENSLFAEYSPCLSQIRFGSPEYEESLKKLGPALEHHRANNRHHPEFHDEGVDGMTLIDLLEMACDWKAASMRSKDGDVMKSLEVSEKRFGLSPQLVKIFANTFKTM